jgi:hypothetical protein
LNSTKPVDEGTWMAGEVQHSSHNIEDVGHGLYLDSSGTVVAGAVKDFLICGLLENPVGIAQEVLLGDESSRREEDRRKGSSTNFDQ